MSVESGGPGGPPDDFNLYNVTHRGEMPTLKQSQSRNYKALKVAFFTHPSDTEKYFVIGGEEIRKLNIFEIHRGLKCISSENFKIITRLNSGDLLLQTSSTQQIDCLKNLTSFGADKKAVTISENGALNKSQAIIRCREIMKLDMETIQEGLNDQKVVHVQRLKRRENNTWVDTATHILTFDSPICPAEINVGYLVVKTELYIPSPFRCVICQRLGHTKKRCDSKKNTPTCGYCAKPLHGNEEPCPGPVKCVNCLGNHPSSSRACPKFIEEKEINAIRVTMRIPYKLAREELKKRKFVQPAAHMKPTAPDNQSKKTFASYKANFCKSITKKPKN
ncbi:uncharacterized protein LOC129801003 [Phlebotomus papatasi]|uniref:uncharacterized protein LOC129801003 n=1 Tax=Phlebotomus papatasi TaxID=29031 RepID=UPI00248345E6|nr:uncharacterized protein LOC129801003 [Phlebotomus papatasi]